jgi:sialidase-1
MEELEQQELFVSGEGGYKRYRIPALAVSTRNTILAFCEARKYTGADSDQIDMFLRRSTDHGRTFGPVQVIATQPDWVCGNPAPVVDRDTGTIWLLFCRNLRDGDETMICEGKAPRTVWVTHSTDDGLTWAEPTEITAAVKPAGWSWYATGPCHGIQLSTGRLLIPCDHIVFENYSRQDPYYSHVLYSDDHGETWQVGGIADEGTNESAAFEAIDGSLCLNCRNKYRLPGGGNYRAVTWSRDGGRSFSPIVHDAALPEPICQASMIRLPEEKGHGRHRALFCNPAALDGRHHLTVRLSYDECRTWPVSRVIHEGPAAYSDLCVTADGHICCFYERGREGPYETITLARFNLEWLSRGADALGVTG